MSYIVSLEGFTPGQRYDDIPWTRARIEESATRDGAYTPIETITLDPVDADPANPRSRDLTSASATLPTGWYRVAFLDAATGIQVSDPVRFPSDTPALDPDAIPDVKDVAFYLRARTKIAGSAGTEAGTFNENTRPDADGVEGLIARAATDLTDAVGLTFPTDQLRRSVKSLIALGAAMLVELTYFQEQVNSGQSPYDQYERMYDKRLKRLIEAVAEAGSGGGGDSVATAGFLPSAYFDNPFDDDTHVPGSEVPCW